MSIKEKTDKCLKEGEKGGRHKGFAEVKLEMALEKFSNGKFSTSEATKIADISVGEMMDELVKRGLKPNITKEDLKDSLETALRVVK